MSSAAMSPELPIVMTIAGHDPTGGAGTSADIETILSQGGHAVSVITCIAVQDTCDVSEIFVLDADLVLQQARVVLEDLPVDVIKIGLLGNEEIVEAVHELLQDYPEIPVVFDPILASGGTGKSMADEDMIDAMVDLIIPLTNVLTPNTHEILTLVPSADNTHSAAIALLELGCEYILLTGTHDNTTEVINRLYGNQRELKSWNWPRLPNNYHGSGCTLSAAIAGLLAQGLDLNSAIEEAQEFTWQSLDQGYRLGMGQYHPNRLFWAEDQSDSKNTADNEKSE